MLRTTAVTIAVVLLVNAGMKLTQKEIAFHWSDTSLTVNTPDGGAYTVQYTGITAITLLENCDFGACREGEDSRRVRYGLWQNERWGDYRLYAASGVENCIVLETTGGILALNCESEETTRLLFESVVDILAERGYAAGTAARIR